MASDAYAVSPMVAAGWDHTVALKSDGTLVAFGNDSSGQLGMGRLVQSSIPLQVSGTGQIRSVAAGASHVLALRLDGTVWAWGSNSYDQLGDGTHADANTPVRVKVLTGVTAIAAGYYHSLALKNDGTVWEWGGTYWHGTTPRSITPAQVLNLTGVTAIAGGNAHTVALKQDGTVWAWGNNGEGQLGDGTTSNRSAPTPVPGLAGIIKIAAGLDATLALKQDGTVWAWGTNDQGQLGDATTTSRSVPTQVVGLTGITSIAIMGRSSLGLKQDGTVWGWGWNPHGQLGEGARTFPGTPVKVTGLSGVAAIAAGSLHTVALKQDGTVWAVGKNGAGELGDGTIAMAPEFGRFTAAQVVGLTGVTMIAAGDSDTVALTKDGTVWAWGLNDFGQLGDNGVVSRTVSAPVPGMSGVAAITAGYKRTHALKQDGTVWAWGENQFGDLGDGSRISRSTPVQLAGFTGGTAIAEGVVLKQDGTVWAWDSFSTRFIPTWFPELTGITAIAEGTALKQDGTVWEWQASTNTAAQVQGLNGVTAIAAARYGRSDKGHTVALKQDGTVWAWGNNEAGQLGDGTRTTRSTPAQVTGLTRITAIAAGLFRTLALRQDGTVWAWGGGPLGDGTIDYLHVTPTQMVGLTGVKSVAFGARGHAIALKQDGTVWAWGYNQYGQLGDGTLADSLIPGFAVNEDGNGLLDLDPAKPKDTLTQLLPFFLKARKNGNDLATTLTDSRATGVHGEVYFSALVPPYSPLLDLNRFTADPPGTVPVALGRGGVKQTGPAVAATSAYDGALISGNGFAVYAGVAGDPLTGSNAIICMGVTIPELSAKGQVLMRPIANGDSMKGVTQCPTIQTLATLQLYRGTASGSISNLTLTATITPQPEDRGQSRNIYSWAVAPDGTQFMQTGDNTWALMREPMQPAKSLTVPTTGDIALPVVKGVNLGSIAGTLVYVGLGSSWTEVKQLNKAGHYYTVQ